MEREEEYCKEAVRYVEENHSSSDTSDCQAAMNIAVVKAFMAGAKWSDEHPHKPTREEILKELRAHAEHTERFYNLMRQIPNIEQLAILQMEEGRKQTIEKACQVLNNMLVEVTYFDKDSITEHYDKYEFIEDFKKAMEG